MSEVAPNTSQHCMLASFATDHFVGKGSRSTKHYFLKWWWWGYCYYFAVVFHKTKWRGGYINFWNVKTTHSCLSQIAVTYNEIHIFSGAAQSLMSKTLWPQSFLWVTASNSMTSHSCCAPHQSTRLDLVKTELPVMCVLYLFTYRGEVQVEQKKPCK